MATLAFAAASKGDKGAHKASYPGGKSASAPFGGFKAVFGTFTLDTDYPDGGYTKATLVALDGLSPYLSSIFCIIPLGGANATNVYIPMGWDFANGKLTAGTDAGAEFATGGNGLDGAKFDCIVLGR